MTFSDFEKLSKMSSLLTIPLIAVCVYLEFGKDLIGSDSLYQIAVEWDLPWLTYFLKFASFTVLVIVTAFAYYFINSVIWRSKSFSIFAVFTLLAYGLLGILYFIGAEKIMLDVSDSLVNQNYVVHLAALSWGFDIFYTIDKSESR
ncbi:hypothetical protein [Vibrio harveyi]